MSNEDPFFMVKEEVLNALNKSRSLYQCWKEQKNDPTNCSKEDPNWVLTELKNKLRSIDWDLEDLEEALGIVENNLKKFKLDAKEIASRRAFIEETREEVKAMKDDINENKNGSKDAVKAMAALLNPNLNLSNTAPGDGGTRYTRLQNEIESPTRKVYNQTEIPIEESQPLSHQLQQEHGNMVINELASNRIENANEQAVMLDEFGQDVDLRGPRFDTAFKKVAKVFHFTEGKKRVTFATAVVAFIVLVVFLWL
ncbi:syntaxin-6 [Tetranychus urticae]|uniref:Syntaxin 6/10/61 N-terminal domain-containing protein n=1 Tax=Tetranychus urticae TaxID=32264 RepID=T1L019_TETUR|nr:syntaxin-6 [Tetranychus urticae]